MNQYAAHCWNHDTPEHFCCLNKAYSAAGLQPVMDAMAEPLHCYGRQAIVNKLVYTEAR